MSITIIPLWSTVDSDECKFARNSLLTGLALANPPANGKQWPAAEGISKAVFRIRIRSRIRIHMFLGHKDPDPDPLVRGMDPDPAPDPDPSIIKQKIVRKTLISTVL